MVSKKRLAFVFLVVLLIAPLVNAILKTVVLSVWDGTHHINIAIDNSDMHIWSLEPSEGTAFLLVIPENVYLRVGSYGDYKTSALSRLSLLEKDDISLVASSLSQTLNVSIDGVIVPKGEGAHVRLDPRDTVGLGGLAKTLFGQSLRGRTTNLTSYDLIRLWFLGNSIKQASIQTLTISKDSSGIEKFILPDNTNAYHIESERFSKIIGELFIDKAIVSEGLTVEVFNATAVSGVANDFAQLLTNMGGKVVGIDKSEEEMEESIIFAKTQSYTAKKLAKMLRGKILFLPKEDSRADLRVVLGGRR